MPTFVARIAAVLLAVFRRSPARGDVLRRAAADRQRRQSRHAEPAVGDAAARGRSRRSRRYACRCARGNYAGALFRNVRHRVAADRARGVYRRIARDHRRQSDDARRHQSRRRVVHDRAGLHGQRPHARRHSRGDLRARDDPRQPLDQNGVWGILTGFCDDLLIENNVASRSVEQHGIYVGNSGDRPGHPRQHVWGNNANGIHMNGDVSQGGDGIISDALVEDNVIYDNGVGGGSGINCDGVQDSLIRNNLHLRQPRERHLAVPDRRRRPVDRQHRAQQHRARSRRTAAGRSTSRTARRNTIARNNILYNAHSYPRQRRHQRRIRCPASSSDYNAVMDRFTTDGGDSDPDARRMAAGRPARMRIRSSRRRRSCSSTRAATTTGFPRRAPRSMPARHAPTCRPISSASRGRKARASTSARTSGRRAMGCSRMGLSNRRSDDLQDRRPRESRDPVRFRLRAPKSLDPRFRGDDAGCAVSFTCRHYTAPRSGISAHLRHERENHLDPRHRSRRASAHAQRRENADARRARRRARVLRLHHLRVLHGGDRQAVLSARYARLAAPAADVRPVRRRLSRAPARRHRHGALRRSQRPQADVHAERVPDGDPDAADRPAADVRDARLRGAARAARAAHPARRRGRRRSAGRVDVRRRARARAAHRIRVRHADVGAHGRHPDRIADRDAGSTSTWSAERRRKRSRGAFRS